MDATTWRPEAVQVWTCNNMAGESTYYLSDHNGLVQQFVFSVKKLINTHS